LLFESVWRAERAHFVRGQFFWFFVCVEMLRLSLVMLWTNVSVYPLFCPCVRFVLGHVFGEVFLFGVCCLLPFFFLSLQSKYGMILPSTIFCVCASFFSCSIIEWSVSMYF